MAKMLKVEGFKLPQSVIQAYRKDKNSKKVLTWIAKRKASILSHPSGGAGFGHAIYPVGDDVVLARADQADDKVTEKLNCLLEFCVKMSPASQSGPTTTVTAPA